MCLCGSWYFAIYYSLDYKSAKFFASTCLKVSFLFKMAFPSRKKKIFKIQRQYEFGFQRVRWKILLLSCGKKIQKHRHLNTNSKALVYTYLWPTKLCEILEKNSSDWDTATRHDRHNSEMAWEINKLISYRHISGNGLVKNKNWEIICILNMPLWPEWVMLLKISVRFASDRPALFI